MKSPRRSRFGGRQAVVLTLLTAAGAVLPQCTVASPPSAVSRSPSTRLPPSTRTVPTSINATVHPVTAAELGASWRPACPVQPGQLRRVNVEYVDFDGQTHSGELIVNQDVVPQVSAAFGELRRLRYPIAKMITVEHYPAAADELSMEDNNTSAFNCRAIPASNRWSQHAYGRAVDLNPVLNPSVDRSGTFEPKNATAYLDRNRTDPGILHSGDSAVRVFTDSGWRWGGYWRSPSDYQHFELP